MWRKPTIFLILMYYNTVDVPQSVKYHHQIHLYIRLVAIWSYLGWRVLLLVLFWWDFPCYAIMVLLWFSLDEVHSMPVTWQVLRGEFVNSPLSHGICCDLINEKSCYLFVLATENNNMKRVTRKTKQRQDHRFQGQLSSPHVSAGFLSSCLDISFPCENLIDYFISRGSLCKIFTLVTD